ncbi:hypothetical protein ABFS82_04G124300 [Erythranthe guttata]|uniref:SAP domain-containing protein n=1 Tax=Erythranthe guttata TaxID=4155 RepID=A0A022RSK7_ERYGU|nr:PREDICTED: uncharacterized protein LOC105951674 [Erythranthe guttata]EYU43049.1 hypothetical protein MIMGU_mgv1a015275mg [Erythranthe guttata]|eukprot:XP_012830579.1 PREDICTED: uncharacterized protein LOC105951674 [Erythranthe guttata]
MDGGLAPSPSNAPAGSDGGASPFLANLPSRGNFSSTVISSNPGSMRVYISNRDTSAPDEQIIKTDQKNILIRSLLIEKQKSDSASKAGKAVAANQGSRKRAAEKPLDGKAAGKKAMSGTQLGSSEELKDLRRLTVERLRALLREKGLSVTGRKDDLIARLKG